MRKLEQRKIARGAGGACRRQPDSALEERRPHCAQHQLDAATRAVPLTSTAWWQR